MRKNKRRRELEYGWRRDRNGSVEQGECCVREQVMRGIGCTRNLEYNQCAAWIYLTGLYAKQELLVSRPFPPYSLSWRNKVMVVSCLYFLSQAASHGQ